MSLYEKSLKLRNLELRKIISYKLYIIDIGFFLELQEKLNQ